MKQLLVIVLLMLGVPCFVFGQSAPQKTPPAKPSSAARPEVAKLGPDHEKLRIWIGNWTYEGEIKATPLGSAEKVSGKVSVRPVLGGFFVEFRGEETGPSGTYQWFEMDGYDPTNRKFTSHIFHAYGGVSTFTYTFEGNNTTYSATEAVGGKQVQLRGSIVFAADLMSFVERREMSLDGKTWIPLSESKMTKSKLSPK